MKQEEKINEELIFTIPAVEVSINKDLPRRRKDMGKIQEMVDSIQTYGQLQPIVINRNNELIMGGRRLTACIMLGRPVRACYKDTIDPVLMRELEIEENLQRKAFTPAEECFAVEELVKMKQEKYGKPTQGKEGGYTLSDAALAIGKTKGSVIESIQIAGMLREFPNLSKAKTKSEIKKTYKGLQRIDQNLSALAEHQKKVSTTDPFKLFNMNAVEHFTTMKDKSIDLIFTDPPYSIDINKTAMTTGGKTAGENTGTGIKYEDKFENMRPVLEALAKESYRITKDNGHAIIFCGKDRFIFQFMYDTMAAAGWNVLMYPMIWVKMSSGQNNQPEKWPSSAYEAILFARKPLSTLVLQGKPDWLQCDIVSSTNKIHPAEKPIPLLKDLISRVCIPNQTMYDPFVGSGALVEAGCEMKLYVTGCELLLESYALALNRLSKWKEKANV